MLAYSLVSDTFLSREYLLFDPIDFHREHLKLLYVVLMYYIREPQHVYNNSLEQQIGVIPVLRKRNIVEHGGTCLQAQHKCPG